jgi:hypothetical protein
MELFIKIMFFISFAVSAAFMLAAVAFCAYCALRLVLHPFSFLRKR